MASGNIRLVTRRVTSGTSQHGYVKKFSTETDAWIDKFGPLLDRKERVPKFCFDLGELF